MDRGRVGFNSVGNKVIRERMIHDRRTTHLNRLKKIKNRKPGTSETIDCTPPKAIEAAKCNPRKKATREEDSMIIEKENKALLQRISAVLTAPPKINDEDYVKMRKIVCTLKTHAGSYEQQILDAHTKQLFVQIKKIGPYYKPKQWELDYRRQLEGQKFMRQVTYKRPKGFVDPFAPKVTESLNDDNSSLANSLTNDKFRMRRANKSYAHINVVRNVKKTNENPNSKSAPVLSLVENNSNTGNNRVISRDEEEVYEDDEYDEDPSTKVNETDGYEAETDEMTQGFNEALLENTEKRLNLAQTVRETRIYDPSFDGEHAFELKATIECFLIDTTTALVIVAKTVDTVGAAPLVAEAEIDLRELCNLKDDLKLFNPLVGTTTPPVQERDKEGSAQDGIASTNISEMDGLFAGGNEEKQPQVMYEYDMNGLEALGRDIVSSVEIRVEDGVPRLVLNVTNNGDGEKDMRAHSNSNLVTHSNSNNDDDEKHQILTTALCRSKNASPVKGVEDEAFINNVLSEGFKISTPVCLTKDLPIKLSRSVKAISYDSKNKPTGIAGNDEASFALLQKKSMELIDCTVKIENMQDERVHINVTFKNASKATWVKAVREDIRRPQHHGGARPILGSSGQNKSMRGEFNSNSVSRKASATSIIAKDEILTTVIGLPSIMQADAELIEEYFHNILDNIYIEYDDHSFTYEIVLK